MNIDELLLLRNSRRASWGGNHRIAEARLKHSRYLAENYSSYDMLRTHLLHPDDHPSIDENGRANRAIRYLMKLDWLVRSRKNVYRIVNDNDIRTYLAGGWLEELVYFAHLAAGVDEAFFGQCIEWKVGETSGQNEIDVIARRGDTLSFTSCKTLRPQRAAQMDTLRNFLTEADYWNIHFANDQGKALLITTADMIDEISGHRNRYPALLARATILDVTIAGIEHLHWNRLVQVIDEHWK